MKAATHPLKKSCCVGNDLCFQCNTVNSTHFSSAGGRVLQQESSNFLLLCIQVEKLNPQVLIYTTDICLLVFEM